MTRRIQLQSIIPLTHDTYHFVFSRPDGYAFTPGQATDLALDCDGWRDETRPFTFTGDPAADVLCFTIKSYDDHDGVTTRLRTLLPGDHVLIGDPWGAIEDQGPGVFLAAGTGVTPFIAILRDRARHNRLEGCALHLGNKSEDDVILRPLWQKLPDLTHRFLYSDPQHGGPAQRLDASYLDANVTDWDQRFYVCGPPAMEDSVIAHLQDRGVTEDRIVHEA